jgi:hypothetical protein
MAGTRGRRRDRQSRLGCQRDEGGLTEYAHTASGGVNVAARARVVDKRILRQWETPLDYLGRPGEHGLRAVGDAMRLTTVRLEGEDT